MMGTGTMDISRIRQQLAWRPESLASLAVISDSVIGPPIAPAGLTAGKQRLNYGPIFLEGSF